MSSQAKEKPSTRLPSSPARTPFTALTASLNNVSFNSPTSKPSTASLKDSIYKSNKLASKTLISSAAAAGVQAGVTSKKSRSPSKSTSLDREKERAKLVTAAEGLTLGKSTGVSSSGSGTSRRGSPVKGVKGLAAGGGLGRMDVVSNDFDASVLDGGKKSPVKKSKQYDRYIPSRSGSTSQDHTGPILVPSSVSNPPSSNTTANLDDPDPTHTSDLSTSLGLDPNKRILSFFSEPPPSQTEHSALLASYARLPSHASGSNGSNSATSAANRRRIAMRPERILDSPGMVDDYYLNLLDWSSTNLVAIGLGESVYVWNAESGSVDLLCSVGGGGDNSTEGSDEYICSVKFTEDGTFLAVGLSSGPIQIYDVVTSTRVRTMSGHLSRVPSLSWSGAILSSGCRTGAIFNSDVRVAQHKTAEMLGHRGEVCGLAWRPEPMGGLSGGGQGLLASGGNDNVVNVWDGRMTTTPKMTKTNHTAAVKAIAWCPWQPSLLATGGGSTDRTIHFWNTTTSARLHSLVTPSQVTSLIFNRHSREILSSHGIPDHQLSIWSYPSLTKVADIPQAHETRILHSCLSPDGTTVATASSDENLKFWKVFEGRTVKGAGQIGAKEVEEDHGIGNRRTKTGIMVR